MTPLERDIAAVLNRHSAENRSNTPDFILAEYLTGCLHAWNEGVRRREDWYGRNNNEGPVGIVTATEPLR